MRICFACCWPAPGDITQPKPICIPRVVVDAHLRDVVREVVLNRDPVPGVLAGSHGPGTSALSAFSRYVRLKRRIEILQVERREARGAAVLDADQRVALEVQERDAMSGT
jgi:hypothetical protein